MTRYPIFWRTYYSNLRQIKLGDSVILLWPSQKIRTLLSRRILSMSFWKQKIRLIYVIIISIWVKVLVFTALFWRLIKIKRKKHSHFFLYGHILTLLVSRCLPRTSTRCIIHQSGPSQAGRGAGGALAPSFLAKQLTLSQPGGQIMATTVIQAPPDFQTLRRAWININRLPLRYCKSFEDSRGIHYSRIERRNSI